MSRPAAGTRATASAGWPTGWPAGRPSPPPTPLAPVKTFAAADPAPRDLGDRQLPGTAALHLGSATAEVIGTGGDAELANERAYTQGAEPRPRAGDRPAPVPAPAARDGRGDAGDRHLRRRDGVGRRRLDHRVRVQRGRADLPDGPADRRQLPDDPVGVRGDGRGRRERAELERRGRGDPVPGAYPLPGVVVLVVYDPAEPAPLADDLPGGDDRVSAGGRAGTREA